MILGPFPLVFYLDLTNYIPYTSIIQIIPRGTCLCMFSLVHISINLSLTAAQYGETMLILLIATQVLVTLGRFPQLFPLQMQNYVSYFCDTIGFGQCLL